VGRSAAADGELAETNALAEIDLSTVEGLKTLRSGGPSLYCKLVGLFETGSTRALVELEAALAGGDHPAAGALCHKLASSAANVGALAFARCVRQLEKSCAERDAVKAAGLYRAIRAAHPELLGELGRIGLKASA
jgi:HPt (histidine-containing phosphotransfer) domain-containing protein